MQFRSVASTLAAAALGRDFKLARARSISIGKARDAAARPRKAGPARGTPS